MPRFLLLLSPTGRAVGRPAAAVLGLRLSAYAAWVERGRRSGLIQGGGALAERSARISRAGSAVTVVERGPGEPEALASYFVIEARDWPAAMALAMECPGADPGTLALFEVVPREAGRATVSGGAP